MGIAVPFFEDGERITVAVTAAVLEKRFAKISGNRQSGPAVSDDVSGGNYRCAQAGAGDDAVGVFEQDQATVGGKTGLIAGPGHVVPVTAGAAIAAGEAVESDATGRAVPLDAGKELGIAMTAASGAGVDAEIKLRV